MHKRNLVYLSDNTALVFDDTQDDTVWENSSIVVQRFYSSVGGISLLEITTARDCATIHPAVSFRVDIGTVPPGEDRNMNFGSAHHSLTNVIAYACSQGSISERKLNWDSSLLPN